MAQHHWIRMLCNAGTMGLEWNCQSFFFALKYHMLFLLHSMANFFSFFLRTGEIEIDMPTIRTTFHTFDEKQSDPHIHLNTVPLDPLGFAVANRGEISEICLLNCYLGNTFHAFIPAIFLKAIFCSFSFFVAPLVFTKGSNSCLNIFYLTIAFLSALRGIKSSKLVHLIFITIFFCYLFSFQISLMYSLANPICK